MQPSSGSDAFELEDSSLAPPPPEAIAPPPAVEAIEVAPQDSPTDSLGALSTPRSQIVRPRPEEVEAIELASSAERPKLATLEEMRAFIEGVRKLRDVETRSPDKLVNLFGEGLDLLSRLDPSKMSGGLESPATRANAMTALAERVARDLEAFGSITGLIYDKPLAEIARTFAGEVLVHLGGVGLQDTYFATAFGRASEVAYYGMILDGSHLNGSDAGRRSFGAQSTLERDEGASRPDRKLTPDETRARMGWGAKKGAELSSGERPSVPLPQHEEPLNEADEPAPPSPADPDRPPAEQGQEELARELTLTGQAEFAALLTNAKGAKKFARYGRVKTPPPPTQDSPSLLMRAYREMGEGARFEDSTQMLVYTAAEAAVGWYRSELALLAALRQPITAIACTMEESQARADRLRARAEKVATVETQNILAIKKKFAEVATMIEGAGIVDQLKREWKRELRVLLAQGEGKIIGDDQSVDSSAWRRATAERAARDAAAIKEQRWLRDHPGSERGGMI